MTVVALTAVTAFSDLGMGAGLLTKISPLIALRQFTTARRYITAAYVSLSIVVVTLTATLWLLSPWLPWNSWLNADGDDTAALIANIAISGFLLNIPASLITRIQYASQDIARANTWNAAAALATIPTSLILVQAEAPSWALILGFSSAPLVFNLTNTFVYFLKNRQIRPGPRHFDARTLRELVTIGQGFFFLTLLMTVAVSFDNLMVAHSLEVAAVAVLSVCVRIFSQIGQATSLMISPLWAINGEAIAHNDTDWIESTARKMSVAMLIFSLACVTAVILLREPIFMGFLHLRGTPTLSLLVGLAAWWVMNATLSPFFMLQNAAGLVQLQTLAWVAFCAISIPLKLIALTRFGLSGLAWAAALAYAATVLPCALTGYRRYIASARIAKG